MKHGILFEEKLAGKRNVVGRRLHNRILQGGDGPNGPYWVNQISHTTLHILAPIMTITRLPNRTTMRLLGSDGQTPVTSSFGALYEGTTGDGDRVVVKIPKDLRQRVPPSDKQIKWAEEIAIAQKFGAASVGPRVFLASTQPKRFLVMEKFGTDLLEHLNDVLEQGGKEPEPKRAAFLKGEGTRIRKAVGVLIGKIANLDHPTTCFGDFRFENIVIEDNEARQIDFDFCYPAKNVNVRVLLQLAASFSQNTENTNFLASIFPPVGRLFGAELWKQRKQVLATLRTSETMHDDNFSILANNMFYPSGAPARDFTKALQVYYGKKSEEEGEEVLRTWRVSPSSVTATRSATYS